MLSVGRITSDVWLDWFDVLYVKEASHVGTAKKEEQNYRNEDVECKYDGAKHENARTGPIRKPRGRTADNEAKAAAP
jgi:hypothetical protein